MRFRKTVSICKGVKLNLSKSGVSCTVGGRGISFNLGSKGVYLNTSLPGTGISDRRKLLDNPLKKKEKEKSAATKPAKKSAAKPVETKQTYVPQESDFQINLCPDGSVELLTRSGAHVAESEAREVRKTDWYARRCQELEDEFREQFEAMSEAFVKIGTQSVNVQGIGLPEDAETVEGKLDRWLENLELPMEFSVQYEYDPERGCFMVDLDLPEIEDIPEEKLVGMASGAMKAKVKTQKELREDYCNCVFGLSMYIASNIFSLSRGTGEILLSGYTQRRNARTGELEDCYILSILFERGAFIRTDFTGVSPMDFCGQFTSRFNPASTGELKKIVPYSAEEYEQLLKG